MPNRPTGSGFLTEASGLRTDAENDLSVAQQEQLRDDLGLGIFALLPSADPDDGALTSVIP